MSLAPGDVADRLFGLANGKPPQQRRQDSTLVYTSFHLAASSTGSRHDHLKVRFRCMVLLKGASSQRDLEVHLAKACAAKPWGKAFGWAIGPSSLSLCHISLHSLFSLSLYLVYLVYLVSEFEEGR